MKGWNIIGIPVALDGYVKETNSTSLGSSYTTNRWGGLWDLGKREVLYSGTHTSSSNATTLTDNTKNWVPNELVGLTLFNVTDNSSGVITTNTQTTITATLSGGTDNDWDTDDAYKIRDGHALKLHYVVSGTDRIYTPIYYWDAGSKLWVQVTANTTAEPVNAYYVRMAETDAIPILVSPDKSVPSKQLYTGWNLVSYAYIPVDGPGKQDPSATIDAALKTVERVPSAAGDVKGYSQVVSPPMNQFPWVYIPPAAGGAGGTFIAPEYKGQPGKETESCVMVPGRGYWVFMQNPGTLAGVSFTPMSFILPY